jgi:predicted DNA-binding transcriptional regulator AlpA
MNDKPNTLELALEGLVRRIICEEIETLKTEVKGEDRLLDAEEAANRLSVSEDWLYRNAKKLPFTRKLGPKMLRFSSDGIQKYLSLRKFSWHEDAADIRIG